MGNKLSPLIFIVEDNKAFNKLIEQQLISQHYDNVHCFISGEECLNHLYMKPDIIIQDYVLQGISGLSVLQRTKKILPDTEFIFLSGKENIDIAINTVRYGAFDYIVKNNVAFQRLLQKIENIIQLQKLKRHNKRLRLYMWLFLVTFIFIAGIFLFFHRR